MTTSTPVIEQPPGRLLRKWNGIRRTTEFDHSPSGLYRQNDDTLQIWHRFGTLGWMHIGDVTTTAGAVTVTPVPSWQGHPWPYALDIAEAECAYALSGPR